MTNAGEKVSLRLECAVYAAGMFSHSLNSMAMVVIPLWVVSLENSPFLIGVGLGSRYFLLLLLSIHTGALMDRLGTRLVMVICGIAGAVLHLAYPVLPWIWALIVLQAFAGLTGSMGWLGSQTLVGQVMKGNPTYAGRLSFSLRIGAFVGPPLVGFVWDNVGPSGAFAVLGVWAFLGVIATILVPGGGHQQSEQLHARGLVPRVSDYKSAFNLLLVPAIALVVAMTMMRHGAIAVHHSFYVVWLDDLGISGTLIGVLMSAWAVLGSISALSVGRLARLFAADWLMVVAVMLQIVLISITPLLPTYGLLLVVMALYGGTMGISQPLMISLMARATSAKDQGKSAGLRTTANQLVVTVLPPIMGGVVELVGLEASFYVIGGTLICLMGLTARAVALGTNRVTGEARSH